MLPMVVESNPTCARWILRAARDVASVRLVRANRTLSSVVGGPLHLETDMEQWRTTTASGYKQVTFGDTRNKSKSYRVNRLVVICFLGLADDTSWVTRHLNGKRDDNRLVNLKPGTPKENCADMLRHGTRMLGSRNPGAIIDEQTAAKIKSDWRPWSRDANKMCIAKRYGVSYSLVDKIVQGERWKHV